ncbi:hypothetical protein A5746_10340 [Mycolicibacterium conceptionense]|uniref:hypothetical protein n=1 Tax=Mycolicibacterium conceptionense TaxID=451644 RepID=UPI0007EC6ECC|nr:hypothetical protein [Mycolicibacterium conceptionense]OBK04687.1 hypothetical protein A5639_20665 [Mycolicibacterium conceptionense]OMC02085.1 hypothetical protein A5746_10340 [Mycolicibacterium conceptionense]
MTESHRCVVPAGRCLGTELDNRGTKHASVVTDEGQLCEKCTRHVSKLINRLEDDWDALEVMLGEKQSQQGVRVSLTTSPAVPLNTDADAKQVLMLELVDLAAEMIAAATDKVYSPPVKRSLRLRAAVALIHPNLSVLLEAPADWVLRWDRSGEVHGEEPTNYVKVGPGEYRGLDRDGNELDGTGGRHMLMSGVDVALELWKLHDLIRGMYGARKRDQQREYPMPCHGCGRRSLRREYGTDLIHCVKCPPKSQWGRGFTEDDYHRLAGFTKFHLKVQEEADMEVLKWLLAESRWETDVTLWLGAETEWQLSRAAQVAGFDTTAELVTALDRVSA